MQERHVVFTCQAEDAVCLADYCDIMRCDVLGNRDFENSVDEDGGHLNTDIQVWRENTEQQKQHHHHQRSTSVVPCESRGLVRMYPVDKSCAIAGGGAVTNLQRYCRRDDQHDSSDMHNHRVARSSYHNEVAGSDTKSNACEEEEEEEEDEEDEEDDENLVEAALPAVDKKQRRRGQHLRKLKSNCKPEELQKLKTQCEVSFVESNVYLRNACLQRVPL